MSTNVKIPIGLQSAVNAVQETIEQAHIYHRCGLNPPHYIINLDAGNGQTTLTEYITESYAGYGVRHFGGLDMFLEYTLDGSMEQLKKVFADIHASAVFTNEFEGVVSLDIAKLANHLNEAQVDVFIKEISKISSYATLVFYVSSTMNRNMVSLVGKIQEALDDVVTIHVDPYSVKDLLEIVKGMIEDAGVIIEESPELDKYLLDCIEAEHITNVKTAKKLCQMMVKHARFESFLPQLSYADVENATLWTDKKEVK